MVTNKITRPQGAVPWGTGSSSGVCCFADRSNRGSRLRGTPKTKKKKIFLRDLLDLSYHAGTCMTEHYLRRESVSLLSSNVQVPVLAYYMRLSRNYQISAGPKGKPVIYHIVCMYVPKSYTCARAVPWFPPLRPNPAQVSPNVFDRFNPIRYCTVQRRRVRLPVGAWRRFVARRAFEMWRSKLRNFGARGWTCWAISLFPFNCNSSLTVFCGVFDTYITMT